MPVKVRLMRIGTKHRPFYRIVAVDERKKRTGGYLDLIGTYNPLTEPKDIKINQEKLDTWKKNGAVLSTGLLRILKQAPQKPPRKPKKEQPEAPVEATAPTEDPVSEEETRTIAIVVLKTENREKDVKAILDYIKKKVLFTE